MLTLCVTSPSLVSAIKDLYVVIKLAYLLMPYKLEAHKNTQEKTLFTQVAIPPM